MSFHDTVNRLAREVYFQPESPYERFLADIGANSQRLARAFVIDYAETHGIIPQELSYRDLKNSVHRKIDEGCLSVDSPDLRARAIDKVLSTLNQRQRGALRLRYGFGSEPTYFRKIGDEFDISREGARYLFGTALRHVKRLPRNGVVDILTLTDEESARYESLIASGEFVLCPEAYLDEPIDSLDLSYKVMRNMKSILGVKTVRDLASKTSSDLLRHNIGFGKKSFREVTDTLNCMGLSLGMRDLPNL